MLTQKLANELFEYRDGDIYWKKRSAHGSKIHIGDRAGRLHRANGHLSGYRHVYLLGKNYLVHRVIFLMFHGYFPPQVDHINGKREDNRIENLRASSHFQNTQNAKRRTDNTTGVKGVYPYNDKFKAQIQCNKVRYTVGYFKTVEEAEKAVKEKRAEIHKEFANHG